MHNNRSLTLKMKTKGSRHSEARFLVDMQPWSCLIIDPSNNRLATAACLVDPLGVPWVTAPQDGRLTPRRRRGSESWCQSTLRQARCAQSGVMWYCGQIYTVSVCGVKEWQQSSHFLFSLGFHADFTSRRAPSDRLWILAPSVAYLTHWLIRKETASCSSLILQSSLCVWVGTLP